MPNNPAVDPNVERLRTSPLLKVYVDEILWQTESLVEHLEAAMARIPALPSDGSHLTIVDAPFHNHVHAALMGAASLRRFLIVPPSPRQKEKARDHALRSGRALMLGDLVQGIDLTPLDAAGVRNAFEHADEELDTLALRLGEDRPTTDSFIVFNLILSSSHVYSPPLESDERVKILRLYVVENDSYFHFGRRAELRPLLAVANALQVRLRALASPGFEIGQGYIMPINLRR